MVVFTFQFAVLFALLVICIDNAISSYPSSVLRGLAFALASVFLVVALVLFAVH